MIKTVFMGTPDFAALILKSLSENYTVSAVFTQPDKPRGRKMVLTPPPVKELALELGIPVYQPDTLRNEAILDILKEHDPDVIVVAAYGKILPSYVLDYPKYGCVNVHASLLPAYRGAAPIQRAIMDGCKETGVTTMLMEKGLDTGDMLEKSTVSIEDCDNFESVHDKLAASGAKLIISTLEGLVNGSITPIKQDDSLATYAAKIETEDCRIDFGRTSEQVIAHIKGLSPVPLAYCMYNGKSVKIISAGKAEGYGAPGEIIGLSGGTITVACKEGAISVTSLKPEGKKELSARDCINGRMFALGECFS